MGALRTREQGLGIFDRDHPLRLQPFELRLLARQEPPVRWLIDLADPATTTLLHPTSYLRVANLEDRLFIPAEYVPLFVEAGWQRERQGTTLVHSGRSAPVDQWDSRTAIG